MILLKFKRFCLEYKSSKVYNNKVNSISNIIKIIRKISSLIILSIELKIHDIAIIIHSIKYANKYEIKYNPLQTFDLYRKWNLHHQLHLLEGYTFKNPIGLKPSCYITLRDIKYRQLDSWEDFCEVERSLSCSIDFFEKKHMECGFIRIKSWDQGRLPDDLRLYNLKTKKLVGILTYSMSGKTNTIKFSL